MILVIFDLDGVIVSTDQHHYQAWKALADKKGLHFDYEINHLLRGVSRAESLEIILNKNNTSVTKDEFDIMLQEKNILYRRFLKNLSKEDILPGAKELILSLRSNNILTAIGSSSKNTPLILEKIEMEGAFDTIVDGNSIKLSKPDPEVFLNASKNLSIDPQHCVVIEDAQAGIDAANAAEMIAIGVGENELDNCDAFYESLKNLSVKEIKLLLNRKENNERDEFKRSTF